MIIFANDLDNITNSESDASFFARNEVILCWIIFKLCSYIDLQKKEFIRDTAISLLVWYLDENLICECSYTYWLQQAKKETKKEGAKA